MVSLVDDLLDVSRITRGKVQLRRERIDLADIVAKAIEMTSPGDRERRHTLNVDVPRGLVLDGDCRASGAGDGQPADERGEVYRPGGHIACPPRREDRRQASCYASPTAARHRAGHAAAHLRPVRARAPGNRPSEGGLGLGLAIVKPGRGARRHRRRDSAERAPAPRSPFGCPRRTQRRRHDRSHGTFHFCMAWGPRAGGG